MFDLNAAAAEEAEQSQGDEITVIVTGVRRLHAPHLIWRNPEGAIALHNTPNIQLCSPSCPDEGTSSCVSKKPWKQRPRLRELSNEQEEASSETSALEKVLRNFARRRQGLVFPCIKKKL